MKVSILVPVYNAAAHLRECLDSCVLQTAKDIEIICVDDGSQDGSAAIVDEYAAKDSRVVLVRLPANQGTHMARKTAVDAAHGDYALFLDADDELVPEACEKLLAAAASNDVDFVLYGVVPFLSEDVLSDGEFAEHMQRLAAVCRTQDLDRVEGVACLRKMFVEQSVPLFPAGRFIRTECLKRAFSKLPDGFCAASEDGLMFYALFGDCRPGRSISDILYRYRFGGGISTSGSLTKAQRDRWACSGDFCAGALRRMRIRRLPTAIVRGAWDCLVERAWNIGGRSRRPVWCRVARLLRLCGVLSARGFGS